MDCGEVLLKYILIIFNIIFVICGILLIILGSIIVADMGELKESSTGFHAETLPILIIVLGCIIFLVCFFGCCGAIRESYCCMIIYVICIFILVCLQIALVVWVFLERTNFLNAMTQIVQDAWTDSQHGNNYLMDIMQMSFKCCGSNGYADWTAIGQAVPSSCCGSLTGTCSSATYFALPGCDARFVDFWSSNITIIRYGGIAVAIIEFIAFIFACVVAHGVRRSIKSI